MSSTSVRSSDKRSMKKTIKVLFSPSSTSTLSSSDENEGGLFTLQPTESHKMMLNTRGLYDPGSGEICIKYVPMSDSTVTRHLYYAYPGIKDPGIKQALLEPEQQKIYPSDGQELYLDICEEMKLPPVRSFLRGLLKEVIDLKYYGVNPKGFRAITMALSYNRYVKRLDLTSNFLNEDACYHLGQMLQENFVLQELILSGCRIQSEGLRRLVVFFSIRSLEELDISRNEIGDSGFDHLTNQLIKGAVIKRLNLSYNELTSVSATLFAISIEGNNPTTHLDLSWNKMSSLKEANELFGQLSNSKMLVELNMSWNNLKISRILKKILFVPTLRILDLSNNRLGKLAAVVIANSLHTAKNLHTLDLSFNPISAEGAFVLINKLRNKAIKLVNLLMDNVEVNKEFIKEYKEVIHLSFRKKCKITHGVVKHDYILTMPDIREIILKRMDYLTQHASKKSHLDIALYFLQKKNSCDFIQPREILRDMKLAGTPLDEELVLGLIDTFPGPKLDKGGVTLDLDGVIEIIHRLWPDKKLPPTPPEQEISVKKEMKEKYSNKKK